MCHSPESAIARGLLASLHDVSDVPSTRELAALLGLEVTDWHSPRECSVLVADLVAGWLAIEVDRADLARELFLRLNGGSGVGPSPKLPRVAPG